MRRLSVTQGRRSRRLASLAQPVRQRRVPTGITTIAATEPLRVGGTSVPFKAAHGIAKSRYCREKVGLVEIELALQTIGSA